MERLTDAPTMNPVPSTSQLTTSSSLGLPDGVIFVTVGAGFQIVNPSSSTPVFPSGLVTSTDHFSAAAPETLTLHVISPDDTQLTPSAEMGVVDSLVRVTLRSPSRKSLPFTVRSTLSWVLIPEFGVTDDTVGGRFSTRNGVPSSTASDPSDLFT